MKKCNTFLPEVSTFVTNSNKKKKTKKDTGQLSELGGLKIQGQELVVGSVSVHGQAPLKQHTFISKV